MRDEATAALLARMEALFGAIASKNLAGIEACYLNQPALLVFLEGPRSSNTGWASIKEGWRHFLEADMVLLGFVWGADLLARASGDGGFVAATNRYHWRIKGRDLEVEMRGTWAMERLDGTWRIVHEHGSFPHPDPYGAGDWSPAKAGE